jgi:hypothetical protein
VTICSDVGDVAYCTPMMQIASSDEPIEVSIQLSLEHLFKERWFFLTGVLGLALSDLAMYLMMKAPLALRIWT